MLLKLIVLAETCFVQDDTLGDLLGFRQTKIHEDYNLSNKPVYILSFESVLFEKNFAEGMIFERKQNGKIHNFAMDAEHGFEEKNRRNSIVYEGE